MPLFPVAGPFNPQLPLTLPQTGIVTPDQSVWFLKLADQLASIQVVVNNALGTNFFALAGQPTLGVGDVGYVGFVTDLAHLVYWDGTNWQWLDGDRPGRFSDFSAAPGTGWGLCDGSTYSYLVVGGATLTTANFVSPNLTGTPAYRKAAAAYTGTINSKTGSTGTGTTGTDDTGDESAHTHGPGSFQVDAFETGVIAGLGAATALDNTIPNAIHGTSSAGSAHHHSVPGLSVPALSVGSIEMANLGVLPYVRR